VGLRTISLFLHHILSLILTSNPHSAYDDEMYSDMTLSIRGLRKSGFESIDGRHIRAQKRILEARSGWFRRELRLPKYAVRHHAERFILLRLLTFAQGIDFPVVEMERRFSSDQNQAVVAYLYGFDITDNQFSIDRVVPTKIDDFLIICVVAEHYKIRGLRNAAVIAASDALARALSDENGKVDEGALEIFLSCDWSELLDDKRRIPHFLSIILGDSFTDLYFHEYFHDYLKYTPKVVRCLLEGLVKEKTLEGLFNKENTLKDPLNK
jgi:hypothetical protein